MSVPPPAGAAAGTGARLLSETFPARAVRGAGLPDIQRLPYPPEMAIASLAGTKHLVLAGATSPVRESVSTDCIQKIRWTASAC